MRLVIYFEHGNNRWNPHKNGRLEKLSLHARACLCALIKPCNMWSNWTFFFLARLGSRARTVHFVGSFSFTKSTNKNGTIRVSLVDAFRARLSIHGKWYRIIKRFSLNWNVYARSLSLRCARRRKKPERKQIERKRQASNKQQPFGSAYGLSTSVRMHF